MKNKLNRLRKSEKFKKMEFIFFSGLSIIIVVFALVIATDIIVKKFSNTAEEIKYIEENGLKYISIRDGYIAEEIKVEAGTLLPTLNDYFDKNYELDEDATITYLEGKESLELSDFTYVKDDNTYVRGIKNLTARIKTNDEEYTTKLVIKDTEKPHVVLQTVEITEGEAIDAARFVAIYVDNSQILDFNATIIGTDSYAKVGTYDIKVNVCDTANNCVADKTKLIIKEEEKVIEEDISSFETGSGEGDGSGENEEPSTPPVEVVPDPTITKLSLSNSSLSPAFKSSVKSYKATVEYAIASVRINATAGTGSTFISGYGTRTVQLKVGANTFYVKVKNSDNKTVAYKIVITRKEKTVNNDSGNTGNSSGNESGTETSPSTPNETPTTPEKERVFIEKRTTERFPYKVTDHYGAKEYHIASEVTYNLYTDNYVEVLSFSEPTWAEWDFTNYKTDVKAMKAEAEDVLAANATTRQYFLEKTNETRAANGVDPVTLDYELCIVATMRTFELTYGNTLSHNRPDGQRFYTILKEYGFKAGYLNGTKHYGENMAYWQLSDAAAYNALVKSSGHKQNILDVRWKKMGIGTFTFAGRKYWIQLFTT